MKEKIRKILQFLLNPRLVLCVAIAWMITNGWSYVMFTLGTLWDINWMTVVAGAYLAFLWIPFTPEKLITFTIAIALLRFMFPQDEKTLAVLRRWYAKAKSAVRSRHEKRREKKQ